MTISLWIKTNSPTGNDVIIANGEGADESFILTYHNDGSAKFRAWITLGSYYGETVNTIPFNDGNWHLLTIVYNGADSDAYIYLDGVFVSPHGAGSFATIRSTNNNLVFGAHPSNQLSSNFNGNLDEVSFWTRVLMYEEIQQLYNNGNGITYPSNKPPTVQPQPDIFINDGEIIAVEVESTDPEDDTLTYSISPEGYFTQNGNIFTWDTTGFSQPFEQIFTIEVRDSYGNSAHESFIVNINNATDLTFHNAEEDIIFSDETPIKNQEIAITSLFYNELEINPDTIEVGFYDDGNLISIDTINTNLKSPQTLEDSYFAQAEWTPTTEGTHNICVRLDPNNQIEEGDEDNNEACRSIEVQLLPDLVITSDNIGFTNPSPYQGQQIQILAMLNNIENIPTGQFTVLFALDDITNIIEERTISMDADSTKTLMVPWTAQAGIHTIYIIVDYYNEIPELDKSNNQALKQIIVSQLSDFLADFDSDGDIDSDDNYHMQTCLCKGADINNDGSTNLIDMALVKSKDGCSMSDPNCAKADYNGDGSVNLIDMSAVKSKDGCLPYNPPRDCTNADLNLNGYVNLADNKLFMQCLGLPNEPPTQQCIDLFS